MSSACFDVGALPFCFCVSSVSSFFVFLSRCEAMVDDECYFTFREKERDLLVSGSGVVGPSVRQMIARVSVALQVCRSVLTFFFCFYFHPYVPRERDISLESGCVDDKVRTKRKKGPRNKRKFYGHPSSLAVYRVTRD